MSKHSKKNERPEGWSPPDAIAWCELHKRGMNQAYIRKKKCIGQRRTPYCKYFKWL